LRIEGFLPSDVTGSISHSHNVVFAGVAEKERYLGLGLDCELLLSEQSLSSVMRSAISRTEAELKPDDFDLRLWATILFSAKESVYKAIFPISHEDLRYDDMEVAAVDPSRRVLHVKIKKPTLGVEREFVETRFFFDRSAVYTVATIPRAKIGCRNNEEA